MTQPPTFLARLDDEAEWARKLAHPGHMKEGRSAHSICKSWLADRNIPREVRSVLEQAPEFNGLIPLLVVVEHQVPLPGGLAASQCDAWVLARRPAGSLVSIGVEAKVDEPFGETLEQWLVDASAGKRERLASLYDTLGVSELPLTVRYQLVHRTAAPILEARRFGADTAVLVVQSFDNGRDTGLGDYQHFLSALGADGIADSITSLGVRSGVTLWAAWVRSTC